MPQLTKGGRGNSTQPGGPDLTQTYLGDGCSWERGGLSHNSASGNCPVTSGPVRAPWRHSRPQPGQEAKLQVTGLLRASHTHGCASSPTPAAFIPKATQQPSPSPYHSQSHLAVPVPPEMPLVPFKII